MVVIEKEDVLKFVNSNWPVHISEIADRFRVLEDETQVDDAFKVIDKHLVSLKRANKIEIRDLGHTKIVLPTVIKKLE